MESLETYLISYQELLTFLKANGKGKNWFDTLRTRHKLLHKPIIKPPHMLSFKEKDAAGRKGRSVFYLREIKPYLTLIIRLHDHEHFTYKQIEEKVRGHLDRLNRVSELRLIDDKCLKPGGFFYDFALAITKLKDYFKWGNSSIEINFLNYISVMREEYWRQFYILTEKIKAFSKESLTAKGEQLMEQRRRMGEGIAFCHRMMEPIIELCVKLIKDNKINVTAEEAEKIREVVDKKMR